jgi:head-tail adaptor
MSLMTGFANKKVDVYHKTLTKTASGGATETWALAVANLDCRVDRRSGLLNRMLAGEQAKDFNILFCDYRTDIREGDKITNLRDKNGNVLYDYRNGVQRMAEYMATNVQAPGSELDHMEIEIYKVTGQSLT